MLSNCMTQMNGTSSKFFLLSWEKIDTPFSEAHFLLRGNHRSPRLWAALTNETAYPSTSRVPVGAETPPTPPEQLTELLQRTVFPGKSLAEGM